VTWTYLEPCTFSQEPVEVSSQTYCWDTDPCALLKSNPIADKYCSSDNETTSCPNSQSGTMSEHLTEPSGEGESMSSAEDSPARTYQHRQQCIGECTDLMVMPAGCGLKWRESLAKYDLNTHLWRTRQTSLFGGLEEYAEAWPRWGMTVDGELLVLTQSDWITDETEYGLSHTENGMSPFRKGGAQVGEEITLNTESTHRLQGLLPTVTATDWKGGTVAIRKDRGNQRTDQWRDYVKIKCGLTYPHPTHSEIRMGWPTGWTELKPLETDKFQQWLRLHGKS